MSNEWGPWIEHDGNGCPFMNKSIKIYYEYGDGQIKEFVTFVDETGSTHPAWIFKNFKSIVEWKGYSGICGKISKYRLKISKSMLLLYDIVETPPKELIKDQKTKEHTK